MKMVQTLGTNPTEDKARCSMCYYQAPPPSYEQVIQMTHVQEKHSAGKDGQHHSGHQHITGKRQTPFCGCQCSQQQREVEEVIEFIIEERPPGRMKVCLGIFAILIVVGILCLIALIFMI